MKDSNELIDFFVKTSSLKRTFRYSSCPERIQEPTAGHAWMVTFMVPILAEVFDIDIDVSHAMEIANVHDLPEYVLDYDYDSYLVATGALKQSDKEKEEMSVMSKIKDDYGFGDRLFSLWKEYEDGESREAKYVKAIDKLECHLHIIERGGTWSGVGDAKHQVEYADKAVRNFPELEPFLKSLKKKLRPLMEKQGLVWKQEYDYPE